MADTTPVFSIRFLFMLCRYYFECERTVWLTGDFFGIIINKSVIGNWVRDDYFDLCKELSGFYENPWYKSKATLKSDYFSTP